MEHTMCRALAILLLLAPTSLTQTVRTAPTGSAPSAVAPAADPEPRVWNTGLDPLIYGFVGRWLVGTRFESAGVDLNGDGDTNDAVGLGFDLQTGVTQNFGLATTAFAAAPAGRVAFIVSEFNQGGTDLNGDGDQGDFVLHVIDLFTGVVTNLGIQTIPQVVLAGSQWLVPEQESTVDLNGDGDLFDSVLQLIDVETFTKTNTTKEAQIASHRRIVEGMDWTTVVGFEAFLQTDLNGDGDMNDAQLSLFEAATGLFTDLPLGLPPQLDVAFLAPTGLLLAVDESAHGADLNGDGDQLDKVLQLFERATGILTNTGLAVAANNQNAQRMVLDGDLVGVVVSEAAQGATDLNGDGDAVDWVVHAGSLTSASFTNTGVAVWVPLRSSFRSVLAASGGFVFFRAYEVGQGNADLNGDGDSDDRVLFQHELATGTTQNLGLATGTDLIFADWTSQGRLVTGVDENRQLVDLNGDGDLLDTVIHVVDAPSGQVTNLGVPGSLNAAIRGELVAHTISEAGTATDLNGDGDQGDFILQVRHLGLGLSWTYPRGISLFDFVGPRLVFQVSESQEGSDLNGDGDQFDNVLHVMERLP